MSQTENQKLAGAELSKFKKAVTVAKKLIGKGKDDKANNEAAAVLADAEAAVVTATEAKQAADDEAKQALKDAKDLEKSTPPCIEVRTAVRGKTRRRAGRAFSNDWVSIPVADLKKGDLEALRDDFDLVVVDKP